MRQRGRPHSRAGLVTWIRLPCAVTFNSQLCPRNRCQESSKDLWARQRRRHNDRGRSPGSGESSDVQGWVVLWGNFEVQSRDIGPKLVLIVCLNKNRWITGVLIAVWWPLCFWYIMFNYIRLKFDSMIERKICCFMSSIELFS